MKFFLIIFILLVPNIVFGNTSFVYFCSEEKHVGFKVSKDHKIGTFPLKRFKILIDFDKRKIVSKKLYFEPHNHTTCLLQSSGNTIYCMNSIGSNFSFNKKILKFVRSSDFIHPDYDDDFSISYGYCEKF